MKHKSKSIISRESLAYNGLAFLYSISAYSFGLYGLFSSSITINVISIFLLSHGMIISAYLVHECAHNLVFRKMQHNTYLGRFLT